MYGYSPKSKEERLKLREFYLTGYTAVENATADCVIATAEEGGHYRLRIFDGTAAYPCVNCYYRTAEQRQREIDRHIKDRLANIQAKEARKQAKNAAGAYVVDESKPHFEAGREYFMTWYGDDPYEHTATIRIAKRTACFVTLVHVYGDREDDPRRVKVSVDQNGEYLSYGSFYYFRASSCVKQEPTEEVYAEQDVATQSAAEAEFVKERDEGRAYIEETAARYPVKAGDPVVTIRRSECPAFYGWGKDELKLSIAAAEIILKHYDELRAEHNAATQSGGYDQTSFLIEYTDQNGEPSTYEGRYDLGDNDGGLIAHIRAFAESYRDDRLPYHSEENAAEISALADLLEGYTAAGRVVSVTVAPWIEKAIKAHQEAAQRHMKETMETLEMLTDEQLTAAVLISPRDNPDVARFFLQELSRRDAKKALAVLRAWKEGLGPGDIDRIA